MKKHTLVTVMLIVFIIGNIGFIQAQTNDNENVISKSYSQTGFDWISVSGAIDVVLIQGTPSSVVVEADENIFENVIVETVGNNLKLSTKNNIKASVLKAVVTLPKLTKVEISGASNVNTQTTFEGKTLNLIVSGASNGTFDVDYKDVNVVLNNASSLEITGKCNQQKTKISGASDFHAEQFVSKDIFLEISGASDADVNATNVLLYKSTGASDVNYNTVPHPKKIISTDLSVDKISELCNDTTNINNDKNDTIILHNGTKIFVASDTTTVTIGKRVIKVNKNDNYVSVKKSKHHKVDYTNASFELGLNGWLNPDFNMSFKGADRFLDLRMEKSTNVNFDWEMYVPFNKKETLGLLTGAGFSFYNFRFAHPVVLSAENDELEAFYIEGVDVRKCKLTNVYFTIPVLFEIQTKTAKNKDGFNFAFGVTGGLRLYSYTKIYFDEANEDYTLQNVETGVYDPNVYTTANKSRNITKNRDSFYMNPFKLDASIRIGWDEFKLYCNYSLVPLFIKDKGPEVYPFAIGIHLDL